MGIDYIISSINASLGWGILSATGNHSRSAWSPRPPSLFLAARARLFQSQKSIGFSMLCGQGMRGIVFGCCITSSSTIREWVAYRQMRIGCRYYRSNGRGRYARHPRYRVYRCCRCCDRCIYTSRPMYRGYRCYRLNDLCIRLSRRTYRGHRCYTTSCLCRIALVP